MSELPPRLQDVAETLELLDRQERIEMLIAIATRFHPVDPARATRPYDERYRVPGCESEVFVWAFPLPEARLELGFAVENPQGISAKALCALLEEALNGQKAELALGIDDEVVYRIFGRELSMGKTMGLMGIVGSVRTQARRALEQV